jgi:hypothetical protein
MRSTLRATLWAPAALLGLAKPLVAGESFPLTLTFAKPVPRK